MPLLRTLTVWIIVIIVIVAGWWYLADDIGLPSPTGLWSFFTDDPETYGIDVEIEQVLELPDGTQVDYGDQIILSYNLGQADHVEISFKINVRAPNGWLWAFGLPDGTQEDYQTYTFDQHGDLLGDTNAIIIDAGEIGIFDINGMSRTEFWSFTYAEWDTMTSPYFVNYYFLLILYNKQGGAVLKEDFYIDVRSLPPV